MFHFSNIFKREKGNKLYHILSKIFYIFVKDALFRGVTYLLVIIVQAVLIKFVKKKRNPKIFIQLVFHFMCCHSNTSSANVAHRELIFWVNFI